MAPVSPLHCPSLVPAPRGLGTEDNPELRGALSTSQTGWGAQHGAGGTWPDPAPPGAAESTGGNRAGAEAAQVPAVTFYRTGHPAPPALTSFRVAQTSGSPALQPPAPPTPLPVPNLATGRAAGAKRRPCKAIAAGRAHGGHANSPAVGAPLVTPRSRPWGVPTAAATPWAPLRVWGCWGSSGCCRGGDGTGLAPKLWHRTAQDGPGQAQEVSVARQGTSQDTGRRVVPRHRGDITALRALRCC